MIAPRVVLESDRSALLADDITHVLDALPQLEKFARMKLHAVSPAAEKALMRLGNLRDKIRKGE